MQNYTILLIDYEPRSIERFRDPLAGAGYTVEVATDGVSGIEAFHRLNPDMVLVEAMIPKKHGFEVCQELKRTPHGRRTPILITTGVYKGRKYRTQALHIYGCDEYIEKPIAPGQLIEIVGKFLEPRASAPTGKAGESESASTATAGGAGPGPQGHETTNAPATSASEPLSKKPPHKDPTVRGQSDNGEAEITARLDAILPGSSAAPSVVESAPVAVAATFDPPSTSTNEDPLARIRAELNAELNAEIGSFEFGGQIEPIPSDHKVSPSVLEALPDPPADAEESRPMVLWETEQPHEEPSPAKQEAAPPAPSRAEPSFPVSAVTQRHAPHVAFDPVEATGRRGIPIWVWAGAVIAVGATLYFLFFSSTNDPQRSIASPAPAPPQVVAEHTAAEESATPTIAEESQPPTTAEESATPLLNAVSAVPPAPKHVPVRVGTPGPSSRKEAPEVTAPAAPAAAPIQTAESRQPAGIEDRVAGVETVPDPTAPAPKAAFAPGALVPIDEADVLPTGITRRAPVYSIQARQMHLSGTVVMNVLINERGTVEQVVLVTGVQGGDVNDSVIRAARSWTYHPATKNGVPVKVWRSEQVVVRL